MTKYRDEGKTAKEISDVSAQTDHNLEVKGSAEPVVHDLAKQKVLSLSKEIVPTSVNKSLNDFIELQNASDNANMFSSVSGLLSEVVSEDCA